MAQLPMSIVCNVINHFYYFLLNYVGQTNIYKKSICKHFSYITRYIRLLIGSRVEFVFNIQKARFNYNKK